ncbi:unnamed protein product [Ambrosiozyma monospora]|uniref:Unnamed protein product n=1 Tax=Ambrosiozyma monospora TaxID=43982 RepID=A0A9W6Z6N9_AMBMO|nr:unnamed protein product [Ambrosiozyma monospora]
MSTSEITKPENEGIMENIQNGVRKIMVQFMLEVELGTSDIGIDWSVKRIHCESVDDKLKLTIRVYTE